MKPFGSFFERIIGQPVPGSVHEMLEVAEVKFRRKLRFVGSQSNLVPSRDVFSHSDVDMKKVNAEIDRYLAESSKRSNLK